MWRARPPDGAEVRRMRAVRERFDLKPLAIHVNYLINLASLDPAIRRRSIDGFRGELERAAAIGAEYVVIHPGSYRGHSVEEGIAAFVLGLTEAAQGFRASHLTVLLENAAGAGAAREPATATPRAISSSVRGPVTDTESRRVRH